ncbi:MAG TPA: monovalent cation/H+ antiporter complex subunit F [Thermomicrobiales bacterium]|jgi:multicomponent Na+:H+ antiporter subunit F|nr:monovalent cation/H+ antiporter complex subunit F [Thermomicrobiales bacterium]
MMHPLVLAVTMIWGVALLAACVWMAIRAAALPERLLAFDVATLVLIVTLAMLSARSGRGYYLDAALALALLSFVSTIAVARYIRDRKVL